MRLLILTSFLLQAFICTSQNNFSALSIDESLTKNANAVVRFDFCHVTIAKFNEMKIVSKRIVTVLNEEGEKFINAHKGYDKETKITKLQAFVYDANGKQIEKFKEKDFLDQSATSSETLYSDNRVKYLRYTPTSYPYTVVFENTIETLDTAFIPNWYFLDGYNVSTEKSIFTLDVLCDTPIRYKENNLKKFGVLNETREKNFKYSVENISARKKEPYAPRFSKIAPSIKFSLERFQLKGVVGSAKNWNDFGKWIYSDLLKDNAELDVVTKNNIKQLISGIDDPLKKVEKIYSFLQDNTRYISVQLGIGGWKPINAFQVDKLKYGDCKGLTNYTMALLKAAGIESYYTVLYAGNSKRSLDKDFASLSGNHAFLNVPIEGEDLWLECTSQEVPLNFLGTFSDDRLVLKITPDGGEIVKTKSYSEKDSRQYTEALIDLDQDGFLKASIAISSSGIQYNQKYRLPLQKKEEIEEHYKDYWDYLNNLKIISTAFENNKKNIVLNERVSIELENYISKAGNDMLLAPNLFNRNLHVPKRVRNRKNSFVISRGYSDEDSFKINIPKNIKIVQLLSEVSVKTEFGEYQLKMKKESDHQISYHRKLIVFAGNFSKDKYEAFRDFKKKVAKSDNAKIILTKI